MNDDLDFLKTNPAVIRLYSKYTSLKKESGRWMGLCPLHQEKNPSFCVHQKDMMWTCFSGCGTNNIFDLIMKKEQIPFKEAVEKVREAVGGKWESQKTQVEAVFKPAFDTAKEYKVFNLSDYRKQEQNLLRSNPAQDWLASRGISLETAKKLHVGFVQDVGTKSKDKDIAAGGWLAFPCIRGDKVYSIKYRSIVRKSFCKQPGMETALYNTDTIDVFEDVYLVEGEIDCLTLEQAGFRAVSLASGSSHPTPAQKDMLMKASRVFLAGDCDGAVGDAIMDKLWVELEERTFRLRWPDGCKDANQTYLEHCKSDIAAFKTLVDTLTNDAAAQPIPDFFSAQEVMRSGGGVGLADDPTRLRFPWPSANDKAILLPGSVMAIYATQTGQGKSALTTQLSLYNAMKFNETVVSWQCELSPQEIVVMMAAQVLRKNRNFLTKEDMDEAAKLLGETRYYISSKTMSSAEETLDLLEMAVKRLGATILLVDHFHHLTRSENNENAIQGMASRRLKDMARKYKLKVINVGQPRKANQQGKGKIVHITDAKGNGSYADDADCVVALHRALNKSEDAAKQDMYESKTLLQFQKARAKGTGSVELYLHFFGEFASFEELDYAHESQE